MPFTIDEAKMKGTDEQQRGKIISMDPAKPPVKPIPFMEFPKVVYRHPREPFKVIVHRNANFEVVGEERVPSEHLTRRVDDAKELSAALKDGWVKEPYIAPPLPDPNAELYAS